MIRDSKPAFVGMAAIVIVLGSGCMQFPNRLCREGFVAWNYRTPLPPAPPAVAGAGSRIVIEELDKQPAGRDLGFPGALLRVVPIACLFAPPLAYTNEIPDDFGETVQLGNVEVARELYRNAIERREGTGSGSIGSATSISITRHSATTCFPKSCRLLSRTCVRCLRRDAKPPNAEKQWTDPPGDGPKDETRAETGCGPRQTVDRTEPAPRAG